MILIFTASFEPSTDAVIEWLLYLKKPFIRVNPDDGDISDFELDCKRASPGKKPVPGFSFRYKDHTISLGELTGYWYRRGYLPPFRAKFDLYKVFRKRFHNLFRGQLSEEITALNDYLFHLLRKVPRRLGDPGYAAVNKMIVLDMANELGLVTPGSYIVSKKQQLLKVMENQPVSITKPIVGLMLQGSSERYFCYTEEISAAHLDDVPEEMFPSLVQEKVEKLFEIRSFFLHDSFYSMAIFSQGDKQTQVDFRKYNTEIPNRTTPFAIPIEIQDKLRLLMKKLNLETGSIDMIVTPEYEYVFLEVNPVGQFGMVSNPCNYQLERKIAEYLAQN